MAETLRNIESAEAETTPERVAADAVASLETSDANYQKWIAGATWDAGKLMGAGGLVVGYGIIKFALKAVEFSANVLEHVAKNMTNIEDPKFYSGLWEAGKKSFKKDDKK